MVSTTLQSTAQSEIDTKEQELEQKRFDGASRFSEFSRILTTNASTAVDDIVDHDLNEASAITTIASAAASVVVPSIWLVFRKKASENFAQKLLNIGRKLNPWYRRFKTAFVIGNDAGILVANFIPLPPIPGFHFVRTIFSSVLGSIIGILFGAFAATFLPDNCADNLKKYFTFGVDGWTKYAKVGFEYGGNIGIVIGGILGFLTPIPGGAMIGMMLGKLFGCFIGAGISIVGVPLYNKILGASEKKSFRTNTIRAGDAVGLGAGILLGAIIGTFIFPGIGTILGSTLGGAIGSIAGGTILGLLGSLISQKVDPSNSSANSWDYGIRTGGLLGSNYGFGAIFTAVLPSKIAPICAAAVTIAGAIAGTTRELYHSFKRTSAGEMKKDAYHLLPWTQSFAAGAIAGSLVGSAIGTAFPKIGLLISGICGLVSGLITTAFCSNWLGKLCKRNSQSTNENPVEPVIEENEAPKDTYAAVMPTLGNINNVNTPTPVAEVSTDSRQPLPNTIKDSSTQDSITQISDNSQASHSSFFAYRPVCERSTNPSYNANFRPVI